MKFSISVVIPNYNGRTLLQRNIPSVLNALRTSGVLDYEIIIPDDASTDDSIEYVKSAFPEIIVIVHSKNHGFAGNVNSGVLRASKDLVLLLNNDVQLTDSYFTPLLQYFDKEDTFGVMGRIIGFDDDKIQDGAKYPEYHFGSIILPSNYLCFTKSNLCSVYLSGANALIDRKKLFAIGALNELFNPYYWEDLDLSIRAWRLGYKLYYEHNAVCRHQCSSTTKKEPGKKIRIISKRNKMFLHYLHLDGTELLCFLAYVTIKVLLRLLTIDTTYFKSYCLFIKSIPELNTSKAEFKKHIGVSGMCLRFRDIVKYIRSDIGINPIQKF